MRQRLALSISVLAAAGVLAIGLSAAGFGPTAQPDRDEVPNEPTVLATEQAIEPEVVYVKPAPKPKTVVKTQRVKASASNSGTRRTTRAKAASREIEREYEREERHEREHDDEHEREDD